MELTSKQRAQLRGMAATMDTILHVGKDGIGDNLVKQANDALEARELIKGTVQQNCEFSAKEALELLCEKVHAEPVQCIGRRFVLYRRSRCGECRAYHQRRPYPPACEKTPKERSREIRKETKRK